MRKPFVAGNWKMFTTQASAQRLAQDVVASCTGLKRVTVALCPPFPYLTVVAAVIRDSAIALGAQNLYPQREGAFTGEVSPTMLIDVGCRYVIVGHSERRHQLGERDEFISQKVKAALDAGLHVILCVGETLEERERERTQTVLETQLSGGLRGIPAESMPKLVLAYEPVWAIGTGKNATPDQAQSAHAFLRAQVGQRFSAGIASQLVIQYGGSVKPENAAALMSQPDVDGALVGGASLKAAQFLAIVEAAAARE